MIPEPVEFGDPQASARRLCDAFEPPERLGSVKVSTRLPATAPTSALLVVRAGAWARYEPPIIAENRVRFTAWDLDEDAVFDVASWYHARLLAYRNAEGDAEIRRFRYDGGPERGVDPVYGVPICAFTLRAVMRPGRSTAVGIPTP